MAEPEKPLDLAGYLEILRNVTPPDYYDPLFAPENPGADRIYYMQARAQAKTADHIYRAMQSRFIRSHSTSEADPASTWKFARGKVRVKRTMMLQDPRRVDAPAGGDLGAMILRGPSGRTYTNEFSADWTENDPVQEKEITFRCTVPGVVGNLDFYADLAGLITLEATGDTVNFEPDLAIIDHANLSDQRSARFASILAPLGPTRPSGIRDSGIPDQFTTTHKGIYVEILDADNAENVGRFLRILEVVVSGEQLPPNSGLYPHTIYVDDLPLLKAVKSAKLDDGGVFTDYTAEASEDTPDDVVLTATPQAVDDAFYFGYDQPFLGVAIAITTPGTGTWTIAWEYWDGAIWTAYPGIIDPTQAFHVKGDFLRVEAPSVPGDWATTTVDGVLAYWLRARIRTFALAGDQPLAAKVKVLQPNRLTPEDGTVTWAVRDWRELGFKITRVEAFAGGRDNDLGAIADERGIIVQDKESDDSLRQRIQELADVVSPAAIRRAVNRQLAPYGLEGRAIDPANGLTGLFTDIDFTDYYSPGDVYPLDQEKLLETDSISYGWFIVLVPYLADGEFGGFCDEGPVVYLEATQTFLASATDMCFLDGFPVKANGVYQAIWEQVNAIRAFGVGFTIILDKRQNTPPC